MLEVSLNYKAQFANLKAWKYILVIQDENKTKNTSPLLNGMCLL